MFTTEQVITTAIITGLLVAVITIILSSLWHGWRASKREERLRDIRANNEKSRIAHLPKLQKKHFLQVPEKYAANAYGPKEKRSKGIYWTRYRRIVAIDREGDVWISLLTPEVIESLKDSEFVSQSLFVPFGGPGEQYGNEGKARILGLELDIYPLFLRGNNFDADRSGWEKWIEIEKAYEQSYSQSVHHAQVMDWCLK